MSEELRIDEGYQHFVSPKRKRMMSPNNCIKISKEQGSTHIQKHRDPGFLDFNSSSTRDGLRGPFEEQCLASSTSGSPSTDCFIRKPKIGLNRRDAINDQKFGSLKKSNLFGESEALGCYSTDDDGDDADEKFQQRLHENQPSERALALKKSFTYGRNFDEIRKGSSFHETDQELQETDAGTESDFSGVAGKMSTLSVGKRASGFSFPTRRGSPGSSPASSQNSSVNSSIALSPALLMDDLLSAEPSSSPRRPRQQQQLGTKGCGLFPNEELPSRNMRSRANRLISSAILNSAQQQTPHNSSGVHGSFNNTHINKYHLNRSGFANHSDTDVLYTTSSSSHTADLLHDHSMASSSAAGDSFLDRHRALEYSGEHSGLKSEDGMYSHEDDKVADGWGHAPLHHTGSLPPRTPFVHKTAHMHHHNHHTSGAGDHVNMLPRIDETPPRKILETGDGRSHNKHAGLAYDASGSPILTPSRGRRRRAEDSLSQSHEAAMGDLGTPVTEVGSPAVLDGMDDLVGEEDDEDEMGSLGSMDDSPERPRARLNSSLLVDDKDRDDPELVMITMRGSDSNDKIRDRRHPRRKISSPPINGGGSTAGPKGRLFEDDSHFNEDDHQYHLFAQQFMVSPTADMDDADQYERTCSPLPHKSRQSSRDHTGKEEEDTVLDSSANSSTMSLTRTNSGVMSLNRTNSMNLTRTGSDTLILSKSSHNNSSNCMDPHGDCSISGTSSAFLPLPDQSAFDGPAHADLSRSSYEASNASIDPLFPTPGSARKKRPVQTMGSPSAGGPPTPLRSLDWGLLGAVSPSVERKHSHRSLKQEAQDQLNAFSRSSGSVDTTPNAVQGIAMPNSESSMASTSSHDSEILMHNRHHHHQGGSCETKDPSQQHSTHRVWERNASPNDSFTSLSTRPALVRQSSLLDTKLLLSQTEDDERIGSLGAAPVTFRSDFEEVGLLGSGTFADVYKVRQVTPGSDPSKFFAVKKSKRQFKSKRDREWLMEEVRTMKLVGGQHSPCAFVVPFIRAWQEDSYFYVQMGFAERGTLRELLVHLASPTRRNSNSSSVNNSVSSNNSGSSSTSNGALIPDNTLWHVVHDVTSGLRHIHECGMVHLDIKPANLLITEQGTIQIGDFGMAATIGSSEDGHEGDTRYMPEELLNNPPRDPSADIFSLGITLYEIACFCSEESSAAASSGSGDRKEEFPLRITPRLGLPSNGPLWHTLRENNAPSIPSHRSRVLQQLLVATMQREPTARPSTDQILSLADVTATEDDVDPVLLCAPKHADVRRNGVMPPYIARSASVQEIMAGGGRGALGLGLSVVVGENNEIDYVALGDGAFTPNFAHNNYSPH